MKLLLALCLLSLSAHLSNSKRSGGGTRTGGGGSSPSGGGGGSRPSPSGGGSRPSPSGGGSRPSPSGGGSRPSPSGGGSKPSPSGGSIPSGGNKPGGGTNGGGLKPPPGPTGGSGKPNSGTNGDIRVGNNIPSQSGSNGGVPVYPGNSGGLRPPPVNPSWPGPSSHGNWPGSMPSGVRPGPVYPPGGYSVRQVPTSASVPQTVIWAPSRGGYSRPGSGSSSLLQKAGIFFAGAFIGNRLSHLVNHNSHSWYSNRYHRNYYYGSRYYTHTTVVNTVNTVNTQAVSSSLVCSFDISKDDTMFDLVYDDGQRVSEIIYECNVNTEWCCDDFDCCSKQSLGLNKTDLFTIDNNATDIGMWNGTTSTNDTFLLSNFFSNLSWPFG